MFKYYFFLLLCFLGACSTTPESLLARQHEECNRELANHSRGTFSDVHSMSGGQIGGASISDPTPPAAPPPTMSACMSFWDEELSRENDSSE